MNNLWVFNPDNDIALGNNLSNFTPPRNARLLREAGAMLMSWIADEGDYILSSSPGDLDWLITTAPISCKEVKILTGNDPARISAVRPWGWSRSIVHSLARLGIPRDIMPEESRIEKIRVFSHRRSSIFINNELMLRDFEVSMPVEFSDIASLEGLLRERNNYVIKSPWSSSGRGIIYSDKMGISRTLEFAEGIIRHQGSVLVEPKLEKLIDFAMLFNIDHKGVSYIGLSIFNTLQGGNYIGNLIGSEEYLTELLCRHIDANYLESLKSALPSILAELIGDTYTGVCGVDMMIYTDNASNCHVAPCIELNLRCTMGYIAYKLAKDLLAQGETGTMTVTYTGNDTISHEGFDKPLFDTDNKLAGGSLSLIPENAYFDIRLTVSQSQ